MLVFRLEYSDGQGFWGHGKWFADKLGIEAAAKEGNLRYSWLKHWVEKIDPTLLTEKARANIVHGRRVFNN